MILVKYIKTTPEITTMFISWLEQQNDLTRRVIGDKYRIDKDRIYFGSSALELFSNTNGIPCLVDKAQKQKLAEKREAARHTPY